MLIKQGGGDDGKLSDQKMLPVIANQQQKKESYADKTT